MNGTTARAPDPESEAGPAVFASPMAAGESSGGLVYSQAVAGLLAEVLERGGGGLRIVRPSGAGLRPALRRLLGVALAAVSRETAKTAYARLSGLGAALTDAGAHGAPSPSALVLDGADAGFLLRDPRWEAYGQRRPLVLVCHNREADLFAQQVDRLAWPGRVLLRDLLGDVARYRRHEAALFARANLVICISAEDADWVRATFPGREVLHLPPVFAERPAQPPSPAPRPAGAPLRLGFLGKIGWWPNREALTWLVEEVLRPMPPGCCLHLFGQGTEAWHAPEAGITGHGFVADSARIWQGTDLMLCPMQSGGGTNVKFAETLFRGLPMLSTPMAARGTGIAPVDGPGLRFREGPGAWRRFLAGPDAPALAAERPPATLSATFSWAGQAGRLAHALASAGILTDPQAAPAS